MTPKVQPGTTTPLKTKQGTFQYKAKDPTKPTVFEHKETSDGYLHVYAKNVTLYTPENSASKIVTGGGNSVFNKVAGGFYGNSENLEIVDGAENNGKSYADEVQMLGSNNSYTAARKTKDGDPQWAKDSDKGDVILVAHGENNTVNARSGNKVLVDSNADGTKVEAYQGTMVINKGANTEITSKGSPNTRGDRSSSAVEVEGHNYFAKVVTEPNTLTIANGLFNVFTQDGKNITQEGEGPNYYKR